MGLEGVGTPLEECLRQANIWTRVANIPHGIECTEWSSYMTKPEAMRVPGLHMGCPSKKA